MRALTLLTWIVFVVSTVVAASQLLGGPATFVIVSGHSMEPTLRSGDIAVLVRHASYRRGDIVAYHVPDGEPGAGGVVIHRVIGGSAHAGYMTQGDNRTGRDLWRPKSDDVIGTMALQIPRAGLVPVALVGPVGIGLAAGLLAFFLVRGGRGEAQREPEAALDAPIPAESPTRDVAPRAAPRELSPLFVVTVGVAVGSLVVAQIARSRRKRGRSRRRGRSE